ncbi:MAG: ATPase [Desulfobacterales bacterium]|nr:MAG: ATPase [Desulfobacterales bacterium]
MKASHIISSMMHLFSVRQPVFLWGPPGVGKSQVIHQAATKMGIEIIDVRAILLDPVDLRGLPKISNDGRSEWCSPAFLPKDGEGILFLDELNAAPPLVQAACYQLVLDRKIGEYQLPDGWAVVGAGNRESDKAVTYRMPSALANRFVHIDFSIDCEEWKNWAAQHDIHPDIVDFIDFRPGLLHDFDPHTDTRAFPSPRSWEFVSRLLDDDVDQEVLTELLQGTIGKGAATEFIGFRELRNGLPKLEDIFTNPMKVIVPSDPSVLSATCEMVGKSATVEQAENVINFADRLPEEFGVLLVREAVRHCCDIVQTSHFTTWAARNADVLV